MAELPWTSTPQWKNTGAPTTEAFEANLARAHLQVAVWRRSLDACPTTMDPTSHGWSRERASGVALVPITVPADTMMAPPDLLSLIKCTCQSQAACKTQRCSCKKSSMACSTFCSCQDGHMCHKNMNQHVLDDTDDWVQTYQELVERLRNHYVWHFISSN